MIEFTYAVLTLDTSTLANACTKAKYMLELARVYTKVPGKPTLHRALSWVDLAIRTIQSHADAKEDTPQLLECYEQRGIIKLKIAAELKKINSSEETLPRQQIDEGSRDFQLSYPIENGSAANFVRKLHQGKNNENIEVGIKSIEEAVVGDEDFAEARYHQFLKEFRKLQLDSTKMLRKEFETLARLSKERVLQAFKNLVCRTTHLPQEEIIKVKLASGSYYLQFDSKGVWINCDNKEILNEILTKGIKHVSIHKPDKKKKVYFCQNISNEILFQTVHSLSTSRKRLKQLEKGIHLFHSFEIAALYKMSIKNEPEKLSRESVRNKIEKVLMDAFLELDHYTIEGYLHHGKRYNKSHQKRFLAEALSHLCRSISNCERLLAHSNDKRLKAKRLDLITKRAHIYKQMGLWNCHLADLHEAIAIGKKEMSIKN